MNSFLTTQLRSAAVLLVAVAAMLLSAQVASALTASYTTGTEVPLTAAGYTATGNTVNFTLNYAPTAGNSLMVVNNTGRDFIEGTFDNLANGAAVDLSFSGVTYHFIAWYYGGDGNNDLVLLWRDTFLAAWGAGVSGQLGNNFVGDRRVPVSVDQSGVLSGKTIVSVVGSYAHSLALCSDGTLAAWGSGFSGQLGDGSVNGRYVPVLVDRSGVLSGKTVVAITAGAEHSLALCSDGTVAAWGKNDRAQLGDNTTTDRSLPVLVNTTDGTSALFGKTVVSIASGEDHNVALCSDGTLATWGGLSYRPAPVLVDQSGVLASKNVVSVAAARLSSYALCSDGTLAAWGRNFYGQLGDGSNNDSDVPVLVNTVDGTSVLFDRTVVAVAAGEFFCLALCSDGALAAWGSNANGQLGNDSTTDSSVPVLVNTSDGTSVLFNKNVVALSAGIRQGLVLCSDGSLATWGSNAKGQLGNDSTTDSSVPVLVDQTGLLALKNPVSLPASGPLASYFIVSYARRPAEIEVEQPPGTDLTDGSASIDFGSTILVGSAVERTFTVRNSGGESLTGLGITIDGAGDFSVTSAPSAQVGPGGSTTFAIRFLPSSAGAKTAALQLTRISHTG